MSEIFHLLHRAGQRSAEVFAEKSGGRDITPRQYAVMAAISRNKLPSQTDLVGMTGVDRSTLADIVRRLVQRRLVHRRRAKNDARAYQLSLTARGEEELQQASAAASETDETLLSMLSAKERETFLDALDKVLRMPDGGVGCH